MNNSEPGRRNKWEILKYVKPICSWEHTVIIRAVIVHWFIYLRIFFLSGPTKETTQPVYLRWNRIQRWQNKLCLSALWEPIKRRKSTSKTREEVSCVLLSGQRCFNFTLACITTSEQSGFAELQMWRGLRLRLARHFPLAPQHSSDGTSESMLERRSSGGKEEDVCQNNVPPGCII